MPEIRGQHNDMQVTSIRQVGRGAQLGARMLDPWSNSSWTRLAGIFMTIINSVAALCRKSWIRMRWSPVLASNGGIAWLWWKDGDTPHLNVFAQKRNVHLISGHPVQRPGSGSEQTISRILCLFRLATTQAAIIYLGRQLPGASSDQPESLQASNLQACLLHAIPSAWSCSRWGLPSQPVTWLLVSSYLTISPLPGRWQSTLLPHFFMLPGGMFLWHFP